VSGSGDATVRIWDMDDYGATRTLTAQPETDAPDDDAGVMAVAISPDGTLIAAGCVDALVRVWGVTTGTLVDVLRGHQNSVHSVVFTKDGGGIVSGALDNTIRCWDLRAKTKKDGIPCTVFAGHKVCGAR
jgi:glucose repression regulatory protein TUP1